MPNFLSKMRAQLFGIALLVASLALADSGSISQDAVRGENAAGTLRAVGQFPDDSSRQGYTVTQLADGSLFVHGAISSGAIQKGALVLDPAQRLSVAQYVQPVPIVFDKQGRGWLKQASPPECHYTSAIQTATLLPSQRILFAGGFCDTPMIARQNGNSLEEFNRLSLWNSKTRKWDSAPALKHGRLNHTATLLADGNVLIVGGHSDRKTNAALPVLDSVELFEDAEGGNATVVPMPSMKIARAEHSASRVADAVLVVGGRTGNHVLMDTELFDLKSQQWRDGPSLKNARYAHSAVTLDDGRVMIVGGRSRDGKAISSVEIYDARENRWAESSSLLFPLESVTAALLSNGDVLVVGSSTDEYQHTTALLMRWRKSDASWHPAGALRPDGLNEIHDIETYRLIAHGDGSALIFGGRAVMRWSPEKELSAGYFPSSKRIAYSKTVLNDGRILLAGGRAANHATALAEIYDPDSNQFTLTSQMRQARYTGMPYQSSLSSVLLEDGRVVVAGGWVVGSDNHEATIANSPDIWDPATGKWQVLEAMRFESYDRVYFNTLQDGHILFFVSREQEDNGIAEFQAWVWNPHTDQISKRTVSATPRAGAAIVVLHDGRVLIVGGRKPEFVPEYRCPSVSKQRAITNDENDESGESDESESCQDVAAHWESRGVATTEVWDSGSGWTSTLDFPGRLNATVMQTLLLKSGDVVLVNPAPMSVYSRAATEAPWIWNARTRTFSELPKLPADVNWPMTEGSDGELIAWGGDNMNPTDAQRLRRGATSWEAMPRFPQTQAAVVVSKTGQFIALAQSRPNVAVWDDDANEWKLKLNSYLHANNPAVVNMDDKVAVIGTVLGNRLTLQTWDRKTNAWTIGSVTKSGPSSTGKAVRLNDGQILNIGLGEASRLICELWSITDATRKECGTLAPVNNEDFSSFSLSALGDGRVVLIAGPDIVRLYDPTENAWTNAQAKWSTKDLRYGEAVRVDEPLLKFQDVKNGKWVDAVEAGGKYYTTAGGMMRMPSLLWDREKSRWAYVALEGMGKNAYWLPDGCAISGLPFAIYNPKTGRAVRHDEPYTGLNQAVMTILADGTVFMVGENVASEEAGSGFFTGKASCAGVIDRSSAVYFPGVYAGGNGDEVSKSPSPENKGPSFGQRMGERLGDWHEKYRWIVFVIVGVCIVYVLLRLLMRWLSERAPRSDLPVDEKAPVDRALSFAMRALLYTLLAIFVWKYFGSFLLFKASQSSGEEASDPKAVPCRFVGVWSVSQGRGMANRVKLLDSGKYEYDERGLSGTGSAPLIGLWEVKGASMVWRHKNFESEPDVNKILKESATSFTLEERNESQTEFQLIEAIKSDRCIK